ncbi:MAG: threonine aldolase family protein [Deltaproteobacteria bacterium]|nr:threonine aldolase family protein [Deltaproteobacteria bacterium]MBW2015925.1 threonine aldolase family protein [Deltaproteobacteria bacterium]MBW2127961.1 threonine aldolase family protein [Deltaproteobacteria bacterium]MBW2303225.1 threonine aldolase family protein [Deltaproteobacteria bacterium]
MKNRIRIDLFSDTITRPTQGMRKAIAEAEVGDEQQREDPTVNRLVEMVCELLGKEDALFLPSGTMCNQVSIRVHCRQGDEIIMDKTAHTRNFEGGGPAALTGAQVYTLEGVRGVFTAGQLEEAVRPVDPHYPRSRMVLIEQTSNLGGGSIWPLDTLKEVCAVAHEHGLACHMDGARLLNAVVATGISAREYGAHFDSLWIDFSKGLGAPVGAALAGSRDFIREAWRWKHQFGGAMRQAGIIAAAAVYSLENHVERLAEDHENAKILERKLKEVGGIRVEPVETNLVFFDVSGLGVTSEEFNARLMAHGVRTSTLGKYSVRAVTHLDVTREQVEEAAEIMARVAEELS